MPKAVQGHTRSQQVAQYSMSKTDSTRSRPTCILCAPHRGRPVPVHARRVGCMGLRDGAPIPGHNVIPAAPPHTPKGRLPEAHQEQENWTHTSRLRGGSWSQICDPEALAVPGLQAGLEDTVSAAVGASGRESTRARGHVVAL